MPAVLNAFGLVTGDAAPDCAQFLGDNTPNLLNQMRAQLASILQFRNNLPIAPEEQGKVLDELARNAWAADLVREKYANGAPQDAGPVAEVGLFVWAGNPAVFDANDNQLPGTYKNAVPVHYIGLAARAVAEGPMQLPPSVLA